MSSDENKRSPQTNTRDVIWDYDDVNEQKLVPGSSLNLSYEGWEPIWPQDNPIFNRTYEYISSTKNSSSSSLQSYNSSFKLNESDYKSFCDRNNTSDCNTLTYKNDSNVNTTHTESSTQPIRKFVKSDNDDFDLNKTI
jgi:hypothetical protein